MTVKSTVEETVSEAAAAFKEPIVDKEAHKRNLADAQDALIKEFNTLVTDTEKLLKHTANVAGDQADELRVKLNENLERAKVMLKERESDIREQGRAAAAATEEYVVSHPWQSVGIAAGVGFLLGLLSSRR
ncbi:ElaB/YgaM/YqjD family protein [Pseudomonas sp. Marseille-QA0892]